MSSKKKRRAKARQQGLEQRQEEAHLAHREADQQRQKLLESLPDEVTCSYHSGRRLVMGLALTIGGLAGAIFTPKDVSASNFLILPGMSVWFAFLLVAIWGVYELVQWSRRSITVSRDGVVYQPVFGKPTELPWSRVGVDYLEPNANARAEVLFNLDGQQQNFDTRTANHDLLCTWLYANDIPRTGGLQRRYDKMQNRGRGGKNR